jgi:hypothetical protein
MIKNLSVMIQARFFIEAQGNHKEIVKNSLKKLLERLKKEEGITVKKESLGEVIEEDEIFSSVLEVDLECSGFLSFLMVSIFYTPSAVEMMEPPELLLTKDEFLEGIAETISTAKNVFTELNIRLDIKPGKKREAGLKIEEIEDLLDGGAIRAKVVIEKTGKTRKGAVSEVLRTLDDGVYINAIKSKKVKSEKPFDGVIGIDAVILDPVTFVDLAVKHMPILVEIKEPEEIMVTMLDLQDICLNLASTFFELSYKITRPGASQ